VSAFRLALFELRRFRGPLRRAALAFLLTVPSLYAGVYLWSNWDPYGRADRIPVAVVDQDRPVEVNGETIAAGRRFTDQLEADRQFDWRFVTAGKARRGLEDGKYFFIITVPRDFSARLASAADGTPRRASLDITLDDANGYIVGIIAATARAELQAQVNAAAQTAYAQAGLASLQDVRAGLKRAAKGATTLKTGAQKAHRGAGKLTSGLQALRTGAGKLTTGSAQVAGGTQQLADAADRVAAAADRIDTPLRSARAKVQALQRQADPDLADALAQAKLAEAALTEARAVITAAVAQIGTLNAGAGQVAAGAKELESGIASARSGSARLSQADGELASGALALARKLTDAYREVPGTDASERARFAKVLANPVAVRSTNLHPARIYGRGVAPFFLSIGLWVFGLIAYILLRPVAPEALASTLRSGTVAAGAWLPAAMLGCAAALVLFAVTQWGLGLDADQPWLLIGLLLVAICTFTAIDHGLRVAFGPIGAVLSLVLLVVQLGGSGGIYPLQVSPGVFDVVHPVLPMTYTIDAFRYAISGGDTAHLVRDVAVTCGFLLAGVGGATWAVARQRRWTITRLRPELEL
jgi:putative membrane protein